MMLTYRIALIVFGKKYREEAVFQSSCCFFCIKSKYFSQSPVHKYSLSMFLLSVRHQTLKTWTRKVRN